jgi:two-component system invasion response regulator UvrY
VTPTRVLIADDSHLFGDAVELILEADERIEVVGRALDGAQAVTLAQELDPDVVLLDISMPGVGGIEAIEAMLRDDAGRRVLVLTGSADPADFEKAQEAGAVGYLTKERIADEHVPGVLEAAG